MPLASTLSKKGLWHRCFPVNIAKFVRIPFPTGHLRWLLLKQLFNKTFLINIFILAAVAKGKIMTSPPKPSVIF